MSAIVEFLYRLIVTLLVLIPSISAIVIACTIIYDKDFRKNNIPNKEDSSKKEPDSSNEPKKRE